MEFLKEFVALMSEVEGEAQRLTSKEAEAFWAETVAPKREVIFEEKVSPEEARARKKARDIRAKAIKAAQAAKKVATRKAERQARRIRYVAVSTEAKLIASRVDEVIKTDKALAKVLAAKESATEADKILDRFHGLVHKAMDEARKSFEAWKAEAQAYELAFKDALKDILKKEGYYGVLSLIETERAKSRKFIPSPLGQSRGKNTGLNLGQLIQTKA